MKFTHVLSISAITIASMGAVSAYTPIGGSVASLDAEIAAIEKSYSQEVSQVFLREMRPGFVGSKSRNSGIFSELLDTGGSNETLEEETPSTVIEENDLIEMYGFKITEEDLPELAISDYMTYSQHTYGMYYNNGIYTVLLIDGTMLQYGSNGVFLTIRKLFEGNSRFVKADVNPPANASEEESTSIDFVAMYGKEMPISYLPKAALYDAVSYDSKIKAMYYDSENSLYKVVLQDGTVLTYRNRGVFLTIE